MESVFFFFPFSLFHFFLPLSSCQNPPTTQMPPWLQCRWTTIIIIIMMILIDSHCRTLRKIMLSDMRPTKQFPFSTALALSVRPKTVKGWTLINNDQGAKLKRREKKRERERDRLRNQDRVGELHEKPAQKGENLCRLSRTLLALIGTDLPSSNFLISWPANI